MFKDDLEIFSNFYNCKTPITIKRFGRKFSARNVEVLFQALKSTDIETFEHILTLQPGQAKRFARKIKLRDDWEEVKLNVMFKLVSLKFKNNPELMNELLSTPNEKLVEFNIWHDNFWGNCICDKCKNIKGEDNLGKILRKIKSNFIEEHNDPYDSHDDSYVYIDGLRMQDTF
jgi:hypothetical protein